MLAGVKPYADYITADFDKIRGFGKIGCDGDSADVDLSSDTSIDLEGMLNPVS